MSGGGSTGGTGSTSNHSQSHSHQPTPAPKILLAKPGLVTSGPVVGKFGRGGSGEDETAPHRSRIPAISSLNLLSESWDFHFDRFLPFLTENTDFTVVGVIGPPGIGKSSIMNELYGFDGSSPGMLPPFTVQSEENRAMAKHCTMGIEPRVSAERFILLDTQPVYSASSLAEMMRPDGSSTVTVLTGENLSAELAQEIMTIQVDLLKHGIPDPSSLSSSQLQSSNSGPDKENKDKAIDSQEYMATPVFVHTRMQHEDCAPHCFEQLKRALALYFGNSSFWRGKLGNMAKERQLALVPSSTQANDVDSARLNPFLIPLKSKDDLLTAQYESYTSAMWKLRDQVLSMKCHSFAKNVSERDWLKNSAKIWELVKNSAIISEYSRTLQSSGMFRK